MSVFFDYCDMYEQAKIECEADIDGDCGSCHGTGSAVDPAIPCSICGGSGLENILPDTGDTTGPGDTAHDTREMLARAAEIEGRLRDATPGEWRTGGPHLIDIEADGQYIGGTSAFGPVGQANASLIANAPTDLACLCRIVRTLTPDRVLAFLIAAVIDDADGSDGADTVPLWSTLSEVEKAAINAYAMLAARNIDGANSETPADVLATLRTLAPGGRS